MIKYTITRKDGQKFECVGESLDAIFPDGLPNAWGKPQRWLTETELQLEGLVKDGRQQLIGHDDMGAELIQYLVESEYTIVTEDITAQLQAEAEAKALKEQEKLSAIAKFKATDFKKDLTNKELTELVMLLYKEVFRGEV